MKIELVSDSLVSIDGEPWVCAFLRKPTHCAISGRLMTIGERAYRPMKSTRSWRRIAAKEIEK